MSRSSKSQSLSSFLGFTLLELLAVIVIISVLAMIALPSYSGFIEKARCLNLGSSLQNLASCNDVRILVPSNGSTVPMSSKFEGDFSKLSKNLTSWIYVYAPKAHKYYLVRIEELDNPIKKSLKNGSWVSDEILIGEDADKGEPYTVGILLTQENSTKILEQNSKDLDGLPPGNSIRAMEVIRQ